MTHPLKTLKTRKQNRQKARMQARVMEMFKTLDRMIDHSESW